MDWAVWCSDRATLTRFRGQCLYLPGFADRNVQGLHPVVQRCCPQLCVAMMHSSMPCQATKHTQQFMRREENFSARHLIVFLEIAVAGGVVTVVESFRCDRLFRRHRVETKLAGLYLPDAWKAKQ